MLTITSASNPRIKELRALHNRKAREDTGLCLVEGIRPVGEACEAGAVLEGLYYAPDLLTSAYALELVRQQAAGGIAIYQLSADLFRQVADKDNPQGIIAVVRRPLTPLESLTPDACPWVVALSSPQDPGNIGTILRTMDAAGARGLVLLDQAADPTHPAAVRASMGALFWQPVSLASWGEFLPWARAGGYHLYGTSAHGAIPYARVESYRRPAVLLLGSEREGLTEAQREACELLVALPMHGRATSLNLAVAAGIMLYDMERKLTD
ncbi:MAG: TrmH family RNA methyltransferase [Anaerolineae bacterium]